MMNKMTYLICLIAVGSFMLSSTLAATYHVSPQGSEEGDGSHTKPWLSIERATKKLQSGDTLVLASGVYEQGATIANLNGASEHPILLEAAKDQRVILDFTAAPNPKGVTVTNCSYIILRHLEMRGAQGIGLHIRNSHHIVIEGNVVHDCTAEGIRLTGGHDNMIRGNICYHTDTGIYVTGGSTRNVVEGCLCAFCNQSSENADGIGTSDAERNTYRYNLLVANNDDGLDTWTSQRNLIEWNFACANGDQREGDGNGFKLGGRWKNRPNSPWKGGENTVRNNLSVWNLATGFTDNTSKDNQYEGNVAFGNLNTGSYASQRHTTPEAAERIRRQIRERLDNLIAAGVIRPEINPLPVGVGLVRELKVWP